MCAEHPGQFCLLLSLYNPWQCRVCGQYHGIAALPGHEATTKLKKPQCMQWTKEGLCNFGLKAAWPWAPETVLWIPGSAQRHLVVKRAAAS